MRVRGGKTVYGAAVDLQHDASDRSIAEEALALARPAQMREVASVRRSQPRSVRPKSPFAPFR